MFIRCTTTVLLAFFLNSATVRGNLLINGGFEEPVIPASLGNDEFTAGSTAVTGWTIEGAIDIKLSGPTVLGTSHSGDQMIDINGSPGPGAVSQSFATVPGQSYLVSLFYSNNPNPASAAPSYSASVSIIGGAGPIFDETVVHAGATPTNMNYLPFSESFVADSTSTTLRLASLQGGFNGVYFDTVSVTSDNLQGVVPEASTLLLAITGFFALLVRRSRRRLA